MSIRMSAAEADELIRRTGATVGPSVRLPEIPQARGRTHTPGRMNKLESQYAAHLDDRKAAGEIAGYWFEAVKLRLADNTWYTPDFLVMLADGRLEFHEAKGHWEDDARVKWKVAAETYPIFAFVAVQRRKGQWTEERR